MATAPRYDPAAFNPSVLQGADQGSLTLDQANQAWRASPVYQSWMIQHGKPTNGIVKLTDSERNGLGKTLELAGLELPDGWEIDQGGNIHTESHLARNLLIAGGIAAAAFGIPAVLGAIGGAAPAAGGALASTATTGSVGALAPALASGSSYAAGLGAAGAGASAAGAAAAGGSSLAGNLLRYALPVAGGIAGSVINAKASSASEAAQQAYLDKALEVEKDNEAYRRKTLEDSKALEAGRYGDYTGRIAPYVATGNSANSRMASLLGLPASPASVAPQPQTAAPAAPSVTTQPLARTAAPPAQPPQAAAPPQAALVTIQAPDGTQRQVPANQAAHWISRGGVQV